LLREESLTFEDTGQYCVFTGTGAQSGEAFGAFAPPRNFQNIAQQF